MGTTSVCAHLSKRCTAFLSWYCEACANLHQFSSPITSFPVTITLMLLLDTGNVFLHNFMLVPLPGPHLHLFPCESKPSPQVLHAASSVEICVKLVANEGARHTTPFTIRTSITHVNRFLAGWWLQGTQARQSLLYSLLRASLLVRLMYCSLTFLSPVVSPVLCMHLMCTPLETSNQAV